MKQTVSVLGAGSYGTALAFCLARNGVATTLWGRDPKQMQHMASARCNEKYLPGATFPEPLAIEADLHKAVSQNNDLLIVTPSHGFSALLRQIKPMLTPAHRIIWATKGLDPENGRLLQDVAREILGDAIPCLLYTSPSPRDRG